MKKIIVPLIIFFFSAACGNDDSKGDGASNRKDITKDPDYQKGLDLVTKNLCFTCHKIDEPLTGPAYREVANKYADMPDTIVTYLAHKIISGGTGTWGSIFMTPHPGVSEEDAKAMVKYIFLLKKDDK